MSQESINYSQQIIEQVRGERISAGNENFTDFKKHFRVGDTLVVSSKLIDKDGKIKILKFEGVCTKKRNTSKNFFVQRMCPGEVAVERSFYYFSRNLEKVEVLKKKK